MADDSTRIHRRDHAREAVTRIAKCIAACDGVDDAILDLLARRDHDGRTSLQRILDKIEWTGTHKALDKQDDSGDLPGKDETEKMDKPD